MRSQLGFTTLAGLAVVLLVACGGSSGGTSPTNAAGGARRDGLIPGAAVTTAPSKSVGWTFTSSDGWHYAGELQVPEVKLTFGKDISTSPPGKARLTVRSNVALPTFKAQTVMPNDPGRTGPPVVLSPVSFWYQVPTSAISEEFAIFGTFSLDDGATSGSRACQPDGNLEQGGFSTHDPYDYAIVCSPYLGTGTSDLTGISTAPGLAVGGDHPETQVDALVSALNSEEPAALIAFAQGGLCSVFLMPDDSTYPDGASACMQVRR